MSNIHDADQQSQLILEAVAQIEIARAAIAEADYLARTFARDDEHLGKLWAVWKASMFSNLVVCPTAEREVSPVKVDRSSFRRDYQLLRSCSQAAR